MKRQNIIKIIIVLIIVLILFGVWYYKNSSISNKQIEYKEHENSDFNIGNIEGFDLAKLKEYKLPIILNFSAEWCTVCDEFNPILFKLNNELDEKAIIKIIDVDRYSELASHYPIMYLPTQVLINSDGTPYAVLDDNTGNFLMYEDDNGKHYVTIHIGMLSENELRGLLKEMGMSE